MRPQSIRILGGTLRRRTIAVPPGIDVRPTGARAREALFNRLLHGGFGRDGGNILAGARVADLCCGTGALAFEALSRGAQSAVLIDKDRRVLDLARDNAESLGVSGACSFINAALPLGLPRGPFDLIFIDPPYGAGLAVPLLDHLAAQEALADGGLVCLEIAANDRSVLPLPYLVHDDRTYGAARIVLLSL